MTKSFTKAKENDRKIATEKRVELEKMNSKELISHIEKFSLYNVNHRRKLRGEGRVLVLGKNPYDFDDWTYKYAQLESNPYWDNIFEVIKKSKEEYNSNLTDNQMKYIINTFLIQLYGYDGKEEY